MKSHPLKVLALLSLLALLVYSNTFSVPFLFDDTTNIVDNANIKNPVHFLDLSGTRYVGFLSFALNYAAGGLNVFGYHLVNLLIHIVNGFLVYWLVVLLLGANRGSRIEDRESTFDLRSSVNVGRSKIEDRGSWIALATALLFIVHPIQTQAVTYIVQRFASLVTLFYLLAVVCYLKWRLISPIGPIRPIYCLASLLSTLLAMKTKENSFTLPVMILLVELVFFRPLRWKAVIPFFLLAAPIIPLSHQNALGEAEGFGTLSLARDTADIGRLDYLFTQFRVIITYLRLLVFPVNQTLDYDFPVYHSFFQPAVFLSFLFLAGLLAFAIGLIGRISSIRLISFGLLWFFLTLSIESSIIPIRDVIFEHRLYLPSVGIFLGAGVVAVRGLERWKKMKAPLVAAGFLILAALSIATWQRNFVWKDKITLWRDVVFKAPGRPRGHYNLGLAWQEKGIFEKAIPSYQMTIRLKPDYADAYNNLGNIYKAQGRLDEAVREYERAFAVEPDHAESRNNLGIIYTMRGALPEAIRLYQKALELKPDYADACNNLGIAYAEQGRFEEAIDIYRKGLSLRADLDRTYFNLGNVYVKQGKFKEAVEEYQAAIDLKPEAADYHRALENALKQLGK